MIVQTSSLKAIAIALAQTVLLSVLMSCSKSEPMKSPEMNESLELKVNESGSEFLKRHGDRFALVERPPGVKFYTAKWPTEAPGNVVFKQGNHSFSVRSVLSVTGNDDPNFSSENILQWHVNGGISDADLIGHDDARKTFFSLLQTIRRAGWKRYYMLGEPRLTKSDAIRYARTQLPVYGLDPDYEPTREEWMSLSNRSQWLFYADHAYLSVALSRDPGRMDIDREGAYFVEFSLVGENEQFRKIVGPKRRATWQASLPEELSLLKAEREKTEHALKAQGINIDEAYVDPPTPRF